jgi:hypothetical protein
LLGILRTVICISVTALQNLAWVIAVMG